MNTSNDKNESGDRPAFYAWWSSTTGTGVATAVLMVLGAALLFGNISRIGIWEPWEADEITIAREYATNHADHIDKPDRAPTAASAGAHSQPSWASPTLDGKPVAEPLLKTWLVAWSIGPSADDQLQVGRLERQARLPVAAAVFVLVLLAFVWIKSHFDTWSALLTGVALVTTPAIFLGVHTLSTELLFAVLSSLAIMAYFELSQAQSSARRWLWGGLLGLALALCFVEHRFFGLVVPVAVIVGYGVCQIPFEQRHRARRQPAGVAVMVDRVDIGLSVAAVLGALGVVVWGLLRSSSAAGDAYFLPHVIQWIAVLVPALVLLAGLLLARKTRAIKCLISGPGLLAAALTAGAVAALVSAYGAAHPVDRVGGEVVGKMPLFSYLLENRLSGQSPAAEHMHFAMWVREVGFSLVPWVALVPLGVGYLSRAARLQDRQGRPISDVMSPQSSLKRLLLVWGFMAGVVVAVAVAFGHFYYTAYLPLVAGVGLMLRDADFFRQARLNSLVSYAMGAVAVATILMVGKDLHRFPDRFMEPYLAMQEDLGLPDSYSFGRAMKIIKYVWAGLLATYFFGLISWAGLTLGSMRRWPADVGRWWRRWRGHDEPAPAEPGASESALARRAAQKQAYRRQPGVLSRIARLAELPSTWSIGVLIAAVVTAGIFLFDFAPQQSALLSERGIFEAYTTLADDDQTLYRYGVSVDDSSVYLGGIPKISRNEAFVEQFDHKRRFFVVIPRDRLAAINSAVRRRFDRNVPVLDASSSRLLLVSNQRRADEPDHNFIGQAIVDDPDAFEAPIPTRFAQDGRIVPASFDDRLELVGWDVNHRGADGSFPSFSWGEKAHLTFYFRVKKRVSGTQKIFMHVDHPGSRLHGDHDPVGGDYPTNRWVPGDIVKDEYDLHIDSYSTPGVYTIWLGFFHGDQRMKVTPKQANDGDDRVLVGKIRVDGML